jgi:hypothetical protein
MTHAEPSAAYITPTALIEDGWSRTLIPLLPTRS